MSKRGYLFIVLLFASSAFGLTVNDIQKQIKLKKAKWTAKEGRHFNLKTNVKERMLGAIIEEREVHGLSFNSKDNHRRKNLPDIVDWRDVNGINYVSSIRDQGRCGSCVAFAATATMEAQFNISHKFPYLDLDFSEQHLWSCDGGGCDSGWMNPSAARALYNNGITDEACSPYKSGASGGDFKCSESCNDAKSRTYKIDDYKNVGGWFSTDEDLMEALVDGPLLSSMKVYEDFPSYESGVYEHVTGKYLGGHAISIVGYNKKEEYWIAKNSWGEDFGEKGFFRIKMGDSGIGSSSYQFTIEPMEGVAKITSPRLGEIISGQAVFDMSSSVVQTESMSLEVRGHLKSTTIYEAKKTSANQGNFIVDIKTNDLADGVYEARAIAKVINRGAEKNYYSPFKKVLILNNKPTLEMMTKNPIKKGKIAEGDVFFEATIKASPIPVQRVGIFIQDSEGEIKDVFNDVPGEVTKIKWKTKKYDDGDYTVWLEASIGAHKVTSEKYEITVKN